MNIKTEMIVREISKVIVGKNDVIRKVLMAILAGGHILLEDVPGVGKTTLALTFSKAMNLDHKRIQFTPDTMAGDVIGFSVYNKATGELEYKPGVVFCNLLLADEINRTSPKTQASLLEAMEENKVTVDGVTRKLPEPFVCIATQNPLGSAGTNKLPDSQLDRFMIRLSMGYPTEDEQIDIIRKRKNEDPLDRVLSLASLTDIAKMKQETAECIVTEDVIRYATQLCQKTREMEEIAQGVSPRAVIALVQISRARAYMNGRGYVIPEDVRDMFSDVCAHRLILTAKSKVHHLDERELLKKIIEETPAPSMISDKGTHAGSNA